MVTGTAVHPCHMINELLPRVLSKVYGLVMMPTSICFCLYALYVFMKRAAMIRRKDPGLGACFFMAGLFQIYALLIYTCVYFIVSYIEVEPTIFTNVYEIIDNYSTRFVVAGICNYHHSGPYEERTGPLILATILGLTIVANFSIKIYTLWYL